MTLKPPTRTLPKLVMKEWPEKEIEDSYCSVCFGDGYFPVAIGPDVRCETCEGTGIDAKSLSDFTRVVEETGILDQERSQKDGSRHD